MCKFQQLRAKLQLPATTRVLFSVQQEWWKGDQSQTTDRKILTVQPCAAHFSRRLQDLLRLLLSVFVEKDAREKHELLLTTGGK